MQYDMTDLDKLLHYLDSNGIRYVRTDYRIDLIIVIPVELTECKFHRRSSTGKYLNVWFFQPDKTMHYAYINGVYYYKKFGIC